MIFYNAIICYSRVQLTRAIYTIVADPDPGSGAFLTPGSDIRNRFFPDPGSRIPDPKPIFMRTFWGKKFYNSLKIGPIIFLQHFKTEIIYNFVKFVATYQGMTTNFFYPSLLLMFLDPRSGIQDPGWVKIGIRDKHPGSATLIYTQQMIVHPVIKSFKETVPSGQIRSVQEWYHWVGLGYGIPRYRFFEKFIFTLRSKF
jgi:hypothetical protein